MTDWTKEQIQAIEEQGNNIIVSAGAGSGKTAVLTERVIHKLKHGISLKQLIILTFTNAAAEEMKQRIKKKIEEEVKSGYDLTDELEYIDQATICTFDAYALYLIKKYSDIINIDKNISIGDKIVFDIELKKIIDNIFDSNYNSQNKEFIKLINDYTVKDDLKLKKVIEDFYESLNNIYDKESYLDNYISIHYSDDYITKSINDYVELIKRHVRTIKLELKKLNNNSEFEEYIEKLNTYLSDLMPINTYNNFKDYILNLSSMPRIPKNATADIKETKERIKKQLDKIKELCRYEDENQIRETINLTKPYIKCIIEILKQVNIQMKEYKYKNNIYEFIDIASLAIDLLKNNDDIRLSIKTTTNEIMIDEYQDTNDIQDIFISLISNNNVYMVGDVKQSIYRFRNANPKLFMKKYNDYSAGKGGMKIDLIKNFRSREEIIYDINNIFDYIMDEEIGGAAYKESHRLVFGNKTYNNFKNENYNLEIYNYDSNIRKNEIEAFIIARDIKSKVLNKYQVYDFDIKNTRDVKYSDFAILIDRSKQFDLYRKIFEYMHIPLCVNKNDSFIHSDEMYTILNLLKLVYSYIDKEYMELNLKHCFMSIARSFLFEYSDNDITDIMLEDDIINSISNESSMFYNIYENTKIISNNLDFMTLEDVLKNLYDSFNIRDKISRLSNYNNINIKLDYLENKARELSNIGYNLLDFINYIDSVINDEDKDIEFKSNDNNETSVSIMTIHSSKGLEFNICYFPELYREFSKNDIQKQFLYNRNYGFIIPYSKDCIDNTIYLDLVKDEYKKEEISERLRLFYVALTRVKQKMIILINNFHDEINIVNDMVSLESRLEYKSFKSVLLSIQNKLEKYVKEITDTTIDDSYKNIYIKEILNTNDTRKITHNIIDLNSKNINQESFSKKIHALINNETRRNIELGKLIHKYFELSIDENEYVTKFKEKLNEIGIDLSNCKMYHEYEFMYEDNNTIKHGIIDLLIETKNTIYIVDYKLKNIESNEYINQLQGYKNYIENKTKKDTYCYLYSIVDSNLKRII